MKMYIAVLDEFPDYMTPTLVAHAVLSYSLEFSELDIYKRWLAESFKKVVVRVNRKEFDKISLMNNVYLSHETSTLNGKKSCAVCISSGDDIPNVLRYAKLWKPMEKEFE